MTISVLTIVLTIIPLSLLLLLLHIKLGLSYRMCKMMFEAYTSLCKICVSAYSVAFIGYMGKAFLAKREEEKNKQRGEDDE